MEKQKLTKTKYIIYGSNGNRGIIKRTLYIDENKELFAKYFGEWWSYTKGQIEHYGIENKETGKFESVTFENLGEDLTK